MGSISIIKVNGFGIEFFTIKSKFPKIIICSSQFSGVAKMTIRSDCFKINRSFFGEVELGSKTDGSFFINTIIKIELGSKTKDTGFYERKNPCPDFR